MDFFQLLCAGCRQYLYEQVILGEEDRVRRGRVRVWGSVLYCRSTGETRFTRRDVNRVSPTPPP